MRPGCGLPLLLLVVLLVVGTVRAGEGAPVNPNIAAAVEKINAEVKRAHEALERHDADVAFEALNAALAVLKSAQLTEAGMAEVMAEMAAVAGNQGVQEDPVLTQLQFMIEARGIKGSDVPPPGQGTVLSVDPDYQREIAQKTIAEEMKKQAEEVKKQQEEIQKQLQKQAEEQRKQEAAKKAEEKQEEAKAQQAKTEQQKQEEAKAQQTKPEQQKQEEAKAQQAKTEQQKKDEAKAQQAKTEQQKQEEAKAQQDKTDQQKQEEAKAQQAKTEQQKKDEAKAQQAKTEQQKKDEAKAQQAKTEQQKKEEAKAQQAKTEQQKKDEAKAQQQAAPLAKAQREAAQKALELANKARELKNLDERFDKMSKQLDDAVKNMYEAAKSMDQQELQKAEEQVKLAQLKLNEALGGLEPMQLERLAALLERIEIACRQTLDAQDALRKSVQPLAAGEQPANPDDKRKLSLQKAAVEQGTLQRSAEAMLEQLAEAKTLAETGGFAEAAKKLEVLQRDATRGRRAVGRVMGDAVVTLAQFDAPGAAASMADASGRLTQLLEGIQDAVHNTASDYESELKRAAEKGARLAAAAQRLASATDAVGQTRTPAQKQAAGKELAYQLRIWVGQLQAREFGGAAERTELLNATQDPAALEALGKRLAAANENDPVRKALQTLAKKTAQDYQDALHARQMRDAEREECPARYRQLVSAYFEALSKVSR